MGQISRSVRPVYVDDSPRAAEGLIRALELAGIGNLDEAARVLQQLLNEESDRMLLVEGERDLFITVRQRVHRTLLEHPVLLEHYRALVGPRGAELMNLHQVALVERTLQLTPAGFEATLRVAQERLESAQFESARLALLELEHHPDRKGERGVEAAEMLTLVAAYVGSGTESDASEWLAATALRDANRWRQQAGLDRAGQTDLLAPLVERMKDPLSIGAAIELDGILSRPLSSDSIGQGVKLDQSTAPNADNSAIPDSARFLYSMPSAWGDQVFVSTGRTVSAWNRFTLELLWRVEEPRAFSSTQRIQPQRKVREPAMVRASRAMVVGLSGLWIDHNRARLDRRVFARDAFTGELVWATTLTQIDSRAGSESVLTGPPIINQGVVMIGIAKNDIKRRLDSATLVGLDLRTGKVLWSRTLGSSGSLNYQNNPGATSGLVHIGGTVYGSNRIGFMYGVDSATGRARWVHRSEPATTARLRAVEPWEMNVPVFDNGSLYLLNPDRTAILKLDAETGRELARMPASQFRQPTYLLRVAGLLVGVSGSNLFGLEIETFGQDQSPHNVGTLEGDVIRGRVVSTGDLLIVPTTLGVKVFDPLRQDQWPVAEMSLESPGMLLPLESELLVVDDEQIHAYLVWDAADLVLFEKMQASDDNPGHAITYADFTYRAGQTEKLLLAVDRALMIVERNPLSRMSEAALERLFESLSKMIDPREQPADVPMLDIELRGELTVRLGRCATTIAQRAAYLILTGDYHDEVGDPERAVESFQKVLDAPEMAQSTIGRGATSVIAGAEAARSVRRVIRRHGRSLYDPYQAAAQRQLASMANELDPGAFEAVARRYPMARAAVEAWAEAANRYERQGKPRQAALALEQALTTARDALDTGDDLLGEITGRLVLHLMQSQQLRLALDVIERFRLESPGILMTSLGRQLEVDQLLEEIERSMRQEDRRPRIGAHVIASHELVGWAIEPAWAIHAPSGVTDRLLMRSADGSQLSMWRIGAGNLLERSWDADPKEVFLWMDHAGVVMLRERGEGGRKDPMIVMRDLGTGIVRWESPYFRTLFANSEIDTILARGNAIVPRIVVPLQDGAGVNPYVTETHGGFDGSTIVIADHIGRLAAFDLQTGKLLWNKVDVVPRLYDIDVQRGTVLIGGSSAPIDLHSLSRGKSDREGPGDGLVIALDARTGEQIQRRRLTGQLRWVRLSPDGLAIVGLDQGLATVGLYRDDTGWFSDQKNMQETSGGWALPGRVLVRHENDEKLWQVETTNAIALRSLDTRGRLKPKFGRLWVEPLGDNVVIATAHGMVLYDRAGNIIGLDERESSDPMLFGGFAEHYAPTLTRSQRQGQRELPRFELTLYSLDSLRAESSVVIEIGAEPHTMVIIDGKILISSGTITTVIDVPTEDAKTSGTTNP